ncbi:MAG: hypothetical protein QF464_12225, partial [Myxococcota bacterium]|nr:hypothetical protein [Myxococcota bacterium]
MARLIWLALLVSLGGCTEGGTVEGSLPSGFLGSPDGNFSLAVVDGSTATPTGDGVITGGDASVVDGAGGSDAADPADGDTGQTVDPDDVEVVSGDDVGPDIAVGDITGDGVVTGDGVTTADGVITGDASGDVPCTPGEPGCGGCGSDAECLGEDDGNLCNGRSVCVDGACVVDDTVPSCDEDTGDPCTVSACDPATGACAVVPTPTGTVCDDGDECTPEDRCRAGVCVSNPRLLCDDGNPCTSNGCADGACVFEPDDDLLCDDGNGCTTTAACIGGQCQGTPDPVDCACVETADCLEFDDGDLCTGTLACEGNMCTVVA